MLITKETLVRKGDYPKMWTALLLGELNTGTREISIQITHVECGGEQSLHSHPESQCYYIIAGKGNMTIDQEQRLVSAGDAIFIPSNAMHGIQNASSEELTYLTANQAFGAQRESAIWAQ